MMAEQLHLTPGRRRWLRRGALLHDMGKLGVGNAMLDKPGKLDAAEWKAMRMHAYLYRADSERHRALRRVGASGWCTSRKARRHGLPTRSFGRVDFDGDSHHHDRRHFRRHLGRPSLSRRSASGSDPGDDGARMRAACTPCGRPRRGSLLRQNLGPSPMAWCLPLLEPLMQSA
ncbi:hypothetical protein THIX_60696 [Thiomonas sp. X19]|nr:hypothetical protein THIX_60696 [Thiomonas sp. X19]